MLKDLRAILTRSPMMLLQDAAGVTAIGVMMAAALYLPNLFT